MKAIALLVSLIFTLSHHLYAAGSPVRLVVQQNVKTKAAGKSNSSTTQTRSLNITLNNISNVQMDNLSVKYTYFTRDMKGAELDILLQGQQTVSLTPVGKQAFTTPEVTSTYTTQHSEVNNSASNVRGPNGQIINVPTVTRVEASGRKIVGHAVRVFDGEKIVAEYYSEQGLQQKLITPRPAVAK